MVDKDLYRDTHLGCGTRQMCLSLWMFLDEEVIIFRFSDVRYILELIIQSTFIENLLFARDGAK